MKSIQENIAVDARNRVPRRLRWEDRTYRVRRLLDYWILQTRWWGREEKRIYFRLETNRGIVEIYRAAESLLPGLASAESESSIPATSPATLATSPAIPDNNPRSTPPAASHATSDHHPQAPTPDSRPSSRHLPIEGDTHTRERRRTDAAYRPDVRTEENLRRKARAADRDRPERVRWVLSKIMD